MYTDNLIRAINSFLWYEGLLEDVDNGEYLHFDRYGNSVNDVDDPDYHFSRPKYKEDSLIIKLIVELRTKKTYFFDGRPSDFYSYNDAKELGLDVLNRHTMLWQILVEMFGECGTSPRTGWIENREGCADFLEEVVYLKGQNICKEGF